MVSAVLNDALRDPISVLLSLKDSQELDSSTQEIPTRVARHFQRIFKEDDAFKQIPALDASHPPDSYENTLHTLVRFRAMVQDTSASPEIYLSLLPNGQLGGWGLAETTAVAADEPLQLQHLKEREVVWAVNVPGESPFISEHLDEADLPSSHVELTPNKFLHKDPLMRDKHVGVQIKLYDPTAAPLKPTDVHTFVGLLTLEHLSPAEDDSREDSLVPTLHTLFSVKHPSTIIPFTYPMTDSLMTPASERDEQHLSVSAVREELLQWIAEEALGGDRNAAEWVLLASIARVQSRQPPLFPLSLTLSRFPKPEASAPSSQTPALSHVLRILLPGFVDVPLSLPLINSRLFAPESRDESLHSGLLQLPAGTTVLFSDSGVQEGQIKEAGVRNIQTLRNAITAQTLDYHFPFTMPYQFPTDLTFIMLTEGRNSAFAETHINVSMECPTPRDCFRRAEEIRLPPPARLETFRRLVGGAKVGDVKVTEAISQHIQADFVRERQENKSTTADDLMTRMAVARLLALSLHEIELTTQVWQIAKDLDRRRQQHT